MARIDDGFSTTITFANYPSVSFYEKEVTPPGMEGGGANEITTMLNTTWRTKAPKKLVSLTDCNFVAAYDPVVYSDVVSMVNENQLITITFPDTSTVAFWGWLDQFTPNANTEGEQPTAQCTIIPSNQNASGTETAPVYTAP
jgi:hypothetical protein